MGVAARIRKGRSFVHAVQPNHTDPKCTTHPCPISWTLDASLRRPQSQVKHASPQCITLRPKCITPRKNATPAMQNATLPSENASPSPYTVAFVSKRSPSHKKKEPAAGRFFLFAFGEIRILIEGPGGAFIVQCAHWTIPLFCFPISREENKMQANLSNSAIPRNPW